MELRLLGEYRDAAALLRPDAAGEEHDLQGAVRPVIGVAHQTNGDILALVCTLNGSPCDSYGLGKVRVGNTGANSWENNSFSQTWCVTPTGTEQQLQLTLVADGVPPPTNTVYVEHVNVIVDASSTTDACSAQGFSVP